MNKQREGTSVLSLVIITSIVMLMLFVVMFRMGFDQFSDASADKIADWSDSNARWDERHATIVMADSVVFLALGLIFMAIALAVHDRSKDESKSKAISYCPYALPPHIMDALMKDKSNVLGGRIVWPSDNEKSQDKG